MFPAPRLSALLVALVIPLAASSPAQAQCPSWRTFAPEGLQGQGSALVVFDDGTGPALYIGGTFSSAGGIGANNVARWDGSTWSALGSGTNGPVYALCVYDDGTGAALYATGEFTAAGGVDASRIAKWDGSAWTPLGHGLRRSSVGPIPYIVGMSLAVFDDGGGPELYVAGCFLAAGDMRVSNLAKWDGTNWSPIGSGGPNGFGFAMTVFDDGTGPALYTSGGGGHSIGRWDGSTWSTLGTGPEGAVTALTVFDDGGGPALIAGGLFYSADGVPATKVASWNGSNWTALGAGTQGGGEPLTLAAFDDGSGNALYVGGDFFGAGGLPNSANIARWDGSNWSTLGSGLDGPVLAFGTFDTGSGLRLLATGGFGSSGTVHVDAMAAWSGSDWTPIGASQGFDSEAVALATWDDGSGPALYAGGSFSASGTSTLNHVGRWNGSSWTPLGAGMNNDVFCLAALGTGAGSALYAGGTFSSAGGTSANCVARWDGSAWSPLGSGTNAMVTALAVFDDGTGPALYAGGQFTQAGGVPVNYVARWNGSSWSALGGGVTGHTGAFTIVWSFAVYDDGTGSALYATGDFTNADGTSASQIARWNGSSWSALGTGLGGGFSWTGHALCVFDDGAGPALFVGGDFGSAGGANANHVARWDGSSWSGLGAGVGGSVWALAAFDDGFGPALVAGGNFDTAGGSGASRIAQWRGSAWSALGAGVSGTDPGSSPRALLAFDDHTAAWPGLWVAGFFESAGGRASHDIAEWMGCASPSQPYCFGDGSGAPCPCANSGSAGHGCANSASPGGALLQGSGTASLSADTFVLTGSEMPGTGVVYFQGTAQVGGGLGLPFYDGLSCAGGTLVRLATRTNSSGVSFYPGSGDPPISIQGQIPATGGMRTYQAWYRDPTGPCATASNLTNALLVLWSP